MLTPETLEALAASRRRVDDLIDGHVESVVVSWLNAMRDVEAEVERVAAANEFDANTRMQHLDIARRDIAERIATLDEEVRMNLTSEINSYVELAAATQPELIATQLPPIGISFNRPDPEAIAWIVQRTTEQITVRHYYLSAEATKAMQAALRTGVAGGINPREAAKRMVKDVRGAFHGGLFRATVIARTEMLDAYRASAHETELANSDVLDGWTWWANVDGKTCISCIGMHGTDHPLDEPGPQDHHQGRCSRLPKTKSWKALGFDTVDEPDGLDVESGIDWFERQPEHVQREIMGPKRFEAWREGRFPAERWSTVKASDGWRDAHHIGNPLDGRPSDWAANVDPDDPLDYPHLDKLGTDELDALAGEAMAAGDWTKAEHLGDYIDYRLNGGIPKSLRTDDQIFDWFEDADDDARNSFLDGLSPLQQQGFIETQFAHIHGTAALGRPRAGLPTRRQMRADYELAFESEFLQAEEFTNGFMLTAEARAAGRKPRDLWEVNEQTAYAWATDDMKAYWDATGGRKTWQRYVASVEGRSAEYDASHKGVTW